MRWSGTARDRRRALTALAGLAAAALWNEAARGQDVIEVVFGEDALRSVTAPRGATINVRLPAQPAAGYLWRLVASEQRIVAVVENSFEGPRTATPRGGDPADHLFVLRAETPGRAELVFAYGRPWEQDRAPERTATLRIAVEG